MKALITLSVAIASMSASAQVERNLFRMEKNYNAENIMLIHTQTDRDCKFVTSQKNTENNYVEFYWSMNNGKERKEVHPMIRTEIKKRVSFEGINAKRDSFRLRLNDLTELNHDLADPSMEVTSEIVAGKCQVKSVLTLGPSGKYKKMDLNRTYCEVSKSIVGLPNGCNWLTIEGTDVDTGEALTIKFKKK